MKLCNVCGINKPLIDFPARKDSKDGRRNNCTICVAKYSKAWHTAKPEYAKTNTAIWYRNNRERAAKSSQAWKAANPEKAKRIATEWQRNNPELVAKRNKKWKSENRDKVNAMWMKRHATKLKASPKWANKKYVDLWYKIAELETERLGVPCQVDHIVPLKHPLVCGLHCEFNLQVLTAKQNQSKNNHFEVDNEQSQQSPDLDTPLVSLRESLSVHTQQPR